ncbi:hypothetical protein BGZ59_003136 [Podila verticillata]|nr:hypothetical protein BGZ59_003136 [Podila verticillata]
MSTHLSRRRKQELRDIAKSLGLANDGTREDIYDRIKEFVATQPHDAALREIVGEDIGSEVGGHTLTNTSSSVSSPTGSRRSSLTTTTTHNTRSSPSKKTVTETRTATRSGGSGRNSSEATQGLKEHQVHGFMNHMQHELHDAKDLAKQLEETLRSKFSSGSSKATVTSNSSSARGGSHSQHPLDHASSSTGRRSSKDHGDDHEPSSSSLRHRRRRSYEYGDGGYGENGLLGKAYEWGQHWVGEIKHRFADCTGSCEFVTCATKPWKLLHDLGSTSTGFVWLTLLLELGVFLSQAYAHFQAANKGHHHDGWFHCLSFFTNWPDFLYPFFSYYGTLFVLPTLLSQLFNVDGSRFSRSHDSSEHHHTPRTGLLSGRKFTTSGLSFFVFKFALTYFLGQSQGLGSLLGHVTGGGVWSGCKYISQIFRYVPQSLGLATSGAGTVLALAESIVATASHRRR